MFVKHWLPTCSKWNICLDLHLTYVVSLGAVCSATSSYAEVRMVAGSRPVLIISWEWHIGLALLCGCLGALEYPTTNSCGPINKSLSLSLSLCSTRWNKKFWINTFTSPTRCCCKKAIECTWWGEGIDPKHFVSLLYISVAIKASLLKFSMFSVHKNNISNIFLEFSNFKIVGSVQIGILNLLQ